MRYSGSSNVTAALQPINGRWRLDIMAGTGASDPGGGGGSEVSGN